MLGKQFTPYVTH